MAFLRRISSCFFQISLNAFKVAMKLSKVSGDSSLAMTILLCNSANLVLIKLKKTSYYFHNFFLRKEEKQENLGIIIFFI